MAGLVTAATDSFREAIGFADDEGRAALLRLTERLRARSWELVLLCEENLS